MALEIRLVGVFVVLALLADIVVESVWVTSLWYSDSTCEHTPSLVTATTDPECADRVCSSADGVYITAAACDQNESSRFQRLDEAFPGSDYVMTEYYNDQTSCDEISDINAYPTWGTCMYGQSDNQSVVAKLNNNGSATITLYYGDECEGGVKDVLYANAGDLASAECTRNSATGRMKIYSSVAIRNSLSGSGSSSDSSSSMGSSSSTGSTASGSMSSDTSDSAGTSTSTVSGSESGDPNGVVISSGTDSSGVSGGAIAGIIVAVIVVIAAAIAFLCYRRRQRARKDKDLGSQAGTGAEDGFATCASPSTGRNTAGTATGTANVYSQEGSGPRSMGGLWEDATIATARIPREKVLTQTLVSRGGFGEVYDGHFNGQRVAIKMLLPEFRKNVKHLNAFLAEVKLMAVLDHPRIVTFVGVAWDALTDLCVVSEFMEGGDLRLLLDKYAEESHPLGFDRAKVTIALHVAHALTYLHSLSPPVLHRDLKSRNILLNASLEAKVTDFGASRERVEQTMTAGVGTSLWMAPEVMMGENYGDKADMFSFGVVLSELDTHALPYAQAHTSNRKMPETVILQRVATGSLRVEFSADALASVVELGKACVSVDPKDRPTAAEAMYRLHTVLTRGME